MNPAIQPKTLGDGNHYNATWRSSYRRQMEAVLHGPNKQTQTVFWGDGDQTNPWSLVYETNVLPLGQHTCSHIWWTNLSFSCIIISVRTHPIKKSNDQNELKKICVPKTTGSSSAPNGRLQLWLCTKQPPLVSDGLFSVFSSPPWPYYCLAPSTTSRYKEATAFHCFTSYPSNRLEMSKLFGPKSSRQK